MTSALIGAAATLAFTAIVCLSALHAWRGWLEYKRLELDRRSPAEAAEEDVGLRIELAGVKERLKKLEAIANGVEL